MTTIMVFSKCTYVSDKYISYLLPLGSRLVTCGLCANEPSSEPFLAGKSVYNKNTGIGTSRCEDDLSMTMSWFFYTLTLFRW